MLKSITNLVETVRQLLEMKNTSFSCVEMLKHHNKFVEIVRQLLEMKNTSIF